MAKTGSPESNSDADARHRAAHDLMSPARGVSIVADMLSVALDEPTPDIDTIRDLSAQLTQSSEELITRLRNFAEDNRG